MSDSPITLDWDEDGLHVTVDGNEVRGLRLEMDGGTVRFVLHTGQAWDFYEAVQDALGDWHAEGMAAARNVAQGLDANGNPRDDGSGYDPLDPKHPDYAENLASLGDAMRKRDRGE